MAKEKAAAKSGQPDDGEGVYRIAINKTAIVSGTVFKAKAKDTASVEAKGCSKAGISTSFKIGQRMDRALLPDKLAFGAIHRWVALAGHGT